MSNIHLNMEAMSIRMMRQSLFLYMWLCIVCYVFNAACTYISLHVLSYHVGIVYSRQGIELGWDTCIVRVSV